MTDPDREIPAPRLEHTFASGDIDVPDNSMMRPVGMTTGTVLHVKDEKGRPVIGVLFTLIPADAPTNGGGFAVQIPLLLTIETVAGLIQSLTLQAQRNGTDVALQAAIDQQWAAVAEAKRREGHGG